MPNYLTPGTGATPGSPASVDYVATQAVSSTSLAGGTMAGPLTLTNQTVAPATPTVGPVVYATGGVLTYTNTQGLVQTLVGSQGGITSAVTVANTAAETVLQTMNLPANDAVAGAVYRQVAWGTYSNAATPTITFTSRLGGVGGTLLAQVPAITLGAGLTGVPWKYEVFLAFLSPTTVSAMIELDLGTSAATDAAAPYVATPTSPTTVSLTTTKAWVVDVTWSAAAAGNTITMGGAYTERVA